MTTPKTPLRLRVQVTEADVEAGTLCVSGCAAALAVRRSASQAGRGVTVAFLPPHRLFINGVGCVPPLEMVNFALAFDRWKANIGPLPSPPPPFEVVVGGKP